MPRKKSTTINYPQFQILKDMKFGPFTFKAGQLLTVGRTETGDTGLKKDKTPRVDKKTGEPLPNTLKNRFFFQIPNKPQSWYSILEEVLFNETIFEKATRETEAIKF